LKLIPALNGYSDEQRSRFFAKVVERVNQLPA